MRLLSALVSLAVIGGTLALLFLLVVLILGGLAVDTLEGVLT